MIMWMQLCSRAFIAGSNHCIPVADETLDGGSDQLEMQNRVQTQMWKMTDNFKVVHRRQLRKVYLYGCPFFHNCMSTTIPNEQFNYPENIHHNLHQAILADNAKKLTNQNGSPDLFTIDMKLTEPASKIVTKQLPNFQAGDLLKINELELLTLFEKPSLRLNGCKDIGNACNLNLDLDECRCGLCSKRKNVLESSVSNAKRLVYQAVHAVCVLPSSSYGPSPHWRKPNYYFINLAHLLLFIACIRGGP